MSDANLKSRLIRILATLAAEDTDLEPEAALVEILAAMRAGIESHDLTDGVVFSGADRTSTLIAWQGIIDNISMQAAAPLDSFAGVPDSIGELRAGKTGRPDAWTPREVLYRLLRQIDDGDISPSQLVVVWTWPKDGETDDRESSAVAFAQSTKGPHEAVGLLEVAKMHMIVSK